MTTSYDAVVLAGGAARRLGGTDKPALTLGGLMLLDRVLGACAGARATVVVGPRRPTSRPVRWTREEPPGGGPLPALAAGLAALGLVVDLSVVPPGARSGTGPDEPSASPGPAPAPGTRADTLAYPAPVRGTAPGPTTGDPAAMPAPAYSTRPGAPAHGTLGHETPAHATTAPPSDVVVVLAADLPFLTAGTVRALVGRFGQQAPGGGPAADTAHEGVVLTDPGGRDQPLAAAYRTEPLRRELALLRAEHGRLGGLPLRMLTAELALARVPDPTGDASFDCDTWDDVAVARARLDAESSR